MNNQDICEVVRRMRAAGSISDAILNFQHRAEAKDCSDMIGDELRVNLKDGKTVTFVITNIDDDSIRFDMLELLPDRVKHKDIDKYLDEVKELLPEELQKCIIPTIRRHEVKGQIIEKERLLFCPAASEVYPPEECYGDINLYTQLDYYRARRNRIRYGYDDDENWWYWLASAYSGDSTYACYVSYGGSAGNGSASITHRVPVCFRISA